MPPSLKPRAERADDVGLLEDADRLGVLGAVESALYAVFVLAVPEPTPPPNACPPTMTPFHVADAAGAEPVRSP